MRGLLQIFPRQPSTQISRQHVATTALRQTRRACGIYLNRPFRITNERVATFQNSQRTAASSGKRAQRQLAIGLHFSWRAIKQSRRFARMRRHHPHGLVRGALPIHSNAEASTTIGFSDSRHRLITTRCKLSGTSGPAKPGPITIAVQALRVWTTCLSQGCTIADCNCAATGAYAGVNTLTKPTPEHSAARQPTVSVQPGRHVHG
jgi:hypothetical protein